MSICEICGNRIDKATMENYGNTIGVCHKCLYKEFTVETITRADLTVFIGTGVKKFTDKDMKHLAMLICDFQADEGSFIGIEQMTKIALKQIKRKLVSQKGKK